jgi:hypothetical protein
MSSESAVNLDQGDPLAEADFHMAYGLYDQAADLVRIALEREPDRRDLRMKLLEIYFVWGNKDAFLQTAKSLEATRDRAPAGEWDKIVIMGKQICPDEPMFASSAGSGRGAGALVDLNLEGGENRVDIDLFGDPEGERSTLDHQRRAMRTTTRPPPANPRDARQLGPGLHARYAGARRGRVADARDAAARRADGRIRVDELHAESGGGPLRNRRPTRRKRRDARNRRIVRSKLALEGRSDGRGLDRRSRAGPRSSGGNGVGPRPRHISPLEETDHPADAPTMVAGLDERSRRMMEEAAEQREHTGLTAI